MLYCDMSSWNINMWAEQFLSFSAPFRPRSKTLVRLSRLAKWNKATPPLKMPHPAQEIHDAFWRDHEVIVNHLLLFQNTIPLKKT